MHIIAIGLNHNTAKLSLREELYLENPENSMKELLSCNSICGVVVLSTCNRTEIYVSTKDIDSAIYDVYDYWSAAKQLDKSKIMGCTYKHECDDAVKHLFKVVASLDSMVIGEMQILGQVRDAYFLAQENNFTNSYLNKLFQVAIKVGKRVRTETKISEGAVSVASVSTDLAKNIISQENLKNIFILGAGKISEITIKNLRKISDINISITNRSLNKAKEFADKYSLEVVPFENRYEQIIHSDILIASTSSDKPIITHHSVFKKLTTKQKLYMIDLAVPRNIDPTLNEIENVNIYSLDDLKEIISSNTNKRYSEVSNVENIISDEFREYSDWYAKQTIIPVMKELKISFHSLGKKIVEQNLNKLPHFSEEETDVLYHIMENYSDKIIKVIMGNLQQITDLADLQRIADTLQSSFMNNIEETFTTTESEE